MRLEVNNSNSHHQILSDCPALSSLLLVATMPLEASSNRTLSARLRRQRHHHLEVDRPSPPIIRSDRSHRLRPSVAVAGPVALEVEALLLATPLAEVAEGEVPEARALEVVAIRSLPAAFSPRVHVGTAQIVNSLTIPEVATRTTVLRPLVVPLAVVLLEWLRRRHHLAVAVAVGAVALVQQRQEQVLLPVVSATLSEGRGDKMQKNELTTFRSRDLLCRTVDL